MLICKPTQKNSILIEESFDRGQTIRFRSLDLKKDLNILHQWINAPHAKFWQMEGTTEKIKSVYQSLLRNPEAHSFIGLLDEQLICLIDCYRVQADELGKFIRCNPGDAGIHLLMAPVENPVKGLSKKVIETFLRYYFSFDEALFIYAEPDIYNHKACMLLQKCGFSFVQNVMLESKAASVYLMTRKQFYATQLPS